MLRAIRQWKGDGHAHTCFAAGQSGTQGRAYDLDLFCETNTVGRPRRMQWGVIDVVVFIIVNGEYGGGICFVVAGGVKERLGVLVVWMGRKH